MQGGIPKKHWDMLRREVLHTYGHEHVLTLAALQDAGKTSWHMWGMSVDTNMENSHQYVCLS